MVLTWDGIITLNVYHAILANARTYVAHPHHQSGALSPTLLKRETDARKWNGQQFAVMQWLGS